MILEGRFLQPIAPQVQGVKLPNKPSTVYVPELYPAARATCHECSGALVLRPSAEEGKLWGGVNSVNEMGGAKNSRGLILSAVP